MPLTRLQVCPHLSPHLFATNITHHNQAACCYEQAPATAHDTPRPRASAEMSERDNPTKLPSPNRLPRPGPSSSRLAISLSALTARQTVHPTDFPTLFPIRKKFVGYTPYSARESKSNF